MEVTTTLKQRTVIMGLPLEEAILPTDREEKHSFLHDLVIFIEHSDGEEEIVKPEIVTDNDGQLYLQFEVDKFSTFSILHVEGLEYEEEKAEETPNPSFPKDYNPGYSNGTFIPEHLETRDHIATKLLDWWKRIIQPVWKTNNEKQEIRENTLP